jgi:hypothetical protein
MSFDLLSPQFLEAVTVTLGSLQAVYFHRAFENKQLETELKELKQWIKEISEKQTTIINQNPETKEPVQKQGKEPKEFPQKEEFQKADAPEKAPQAKEPIVEEKLTWERIAKAEELGRARELYDLRKGQEKALEGIIKGVEKKGNDPVELEEKRRAFEEQCKRQLEAKMREQQERLERRELEFKSPPKDRERG